MKEYFKNDGIIDWKDSSVSNLGKNIVLMSNNKEEIAKKCFDWVRDNIKHSYDYKLNPVTCKASDVLKYGTGYCYSKSHLLTALLRVNSIPAGLCYQRLIKDDNSGKLCLHGLTAIYLEKYGWYRADPRGNKEGIDAQFDPPVEKIAYKSNNGLVSDLPGIWAEPLKIVVDVLLKSKSYIEVYNNLPDVETNKK